MENEHVIILLVGRTSSGKSSLIKKLCERTGLKQLISYTTRPRRNNNDNDHLFVTTEDYLQAKENGDIVAETEIAGNYYYATKEQLYKTDLYTIDPIGRECLLSMELPGIRSVTVYISCSDEERKLRAEKRGDDRHTYRVRDFSERQQFRRFVADEQWDYSIKNNDFAKAYSCLRWISQLEGLWKNHMGEELECTV
jgi:guanylate kinase